jgi:hypothetical protein
MNLLFYEMFLCFTCNKAHGMLLSSSPPPSLLTLINIIFGFAIVGFLWDVVACRGVCVSAATFVVSVVFY